MAIDFNDPEVQAELKAAGLMNQEQVKAAGYLNSTEIQTAGYVAPDALEEKIREANAKLELNKNDILAQLKAEKEARQELANKANGIDLDAAKAWQDKLNEDETARLFAAGDKDAIRKAFTAESDAKILELQGELSKAEIARLQKEKDLVEQLETVKSQSKQTDIKSRIDTAIGKIRDQIQPTGVSDVARDALSVCDLDENGKLVIKSDSGVTRTTDKGEMTVDEFLQELVTKKPHLFNGASGGGDNKAITPQKGPNGETLTARQKLELKRKQGK